MNNLYNAFLRILIAAILFISLYGCSSNDEQPYNDDEYVKFNENIFDKLDSQTLPFISNVISGTNYEYLVDAVLESEYGEVNVHLGIYDIKFSTFNEIFAEEDPWHDYVFATKDDNDSNELYLLAQNKKLYVFDENYIKKDEYDWGSVGFIDKIDGSWRVKISGGIFYISFNDKIISVDISGNTISEYSNDGNSNFLVVDDDIFIENIGANGYINLIKLDTKTLEYKSTINLGSIRSSIKLSFDPKNKLVFIADDSAILSLASKDDELKNVVSFNETNTRKLFLNLERIMYFEVNSDGDFNLLLADSYNYTNRFVTISKSDINGMNNTNISQQENNQLLKKQPIKIYLPYSYLPIERVAYDFEELHPDYDIQIEAFSDDGNIFGEDYIMQVNTKILSGLLNYDIISNEYLPVNTYADKKILANLNDIPGWDFYKDSSNYYTNIFEACKYNEDLYLLPATIAFVTTFTEKDSNDFEDILSLSNSWQWDDFTAYLNQKLLNGEHNILSASFPFEQNMAAYTPNIYISYIQNMLYDPLYVLDEKFTNALHAYKDMLSYYEYVDNSWGKFTFLTSTSLLLADSEMLISFLNSNELISTPSENNKKPFEIQSSYSILQNSENKEMVLTFLKYFIDNIDDIGCMLSVSKKDTKVISEYIGAHSLNRVGLLDSNYMTIDNVVQKFKIEKESLNFAIMPDFSLHRSVYSVITHYSNGVISESEAVNQINDIIWLYKNE